MTATLETLRDDCGAYPGLDPAFVAKQMHPVPEAPVLDRGQFILRRARGKVVLDIGASGKMHDALVRHAKKCYGIDRPPPGWSDILGPCPEVSPGVVGLDLDDVEAELPRFPDVELIVCGEVLEHLTNPGHFLRRLKQTYPGVPKIITVPNGFSDIARKRMEGGVEATNADHNCWYSWKTLTVLLAKCGYAVKAWGWYKGRPRFAEGLVVLTE